METVTNRNLTQKIMRGFKQYLVDNTAILVPTHPVFSAMEVGVYGMSDETSINTRFLITGLTYAGFGLAFTKGRDLSRKFFQMTGKTKEAIQTFHDSAYTFIFNFLVMPPIYLAMGADIKQSVIGGLSSGLIGIVTGPIMGYSVDAARDLTGLKECERKSYPRILRRQSSSVKMGLAGLLVAGSIAAMAGIYSLTSNKPNSENPQSQQTVETMVSH